MKLLDTTFLIDLLKGKPETKDIFSSKDDLLTTPINMYEIITGSFLSGVPPAKLLKVYELFESIYILPLDDSGVIKSAEICADLTKKGQAIGDCDCLTAGIAMSKGVHVIVTRNQKHFRRIKNIQVEEY